MKPRERTKIFEHAPYEVHLSFTNTLFIYDRERNRTERPQLCSRSGHLGIGDMDEVRYPAWKEVPPALHEFVRQFLLRKRDRFAGTRYFGGQKIAGITEIINHEEFPPVLIPDDVRERYCHRGREMEAAA